MRSEIRNGLERDILETVELFGKVIDEIHKKSSGEVKEQYKAAYTKERLKELIRDKRGIYLVLQVDTKIVGFLFGWMAGGVGNVHWVGVDDSMRGHDFGKLLLKAALNEFRRLDCYKAELFAYPEFPAAIGLFKKLGFVETAFIEKNFFGMSVIYMTKELKEVADSVKTKKIVLAGAAGQGIKLTAQVLADILGKLQKNVSLNVVYGPTVRSGEVEAELVYSDGKIEVPFIEKPDILLLLSKVDVSQYKAKEIIIEKSLLELEEVSSDITFPETEHISFSKIATEEFGSSRYINMLALGRLLRHIGINIEKINFKSELPPQFLEENIKAIRYGYAYRDYSGRSE